jgi:hypothetical protein
MSVGADILGRRGRGRMFLPGPTSNILSSAGSSSYGKVAAAAAGVLNTANKDLIDDLQGITGESTNQPIVVVTSAGQSTAIRPSYVRVGDHVDVQRRRQHQVTEGYTVLSL